MTCQRFNHALCESPNKTNRVNNIHSNQRRVF